MPYYAGVQNPGTAEFGIVIRSYNRRPNRKKQRTGGILPPDNTLSSFRLTW
jgi:hypothetical protein